MGTKGTRWFGFGLWRFLIAVTLTCSGFAQTATGSADKQLSTRREVDSIQDSIYRLDFEKALELSRAMTEKYPQDPTGLAMISVVRWNQLLHAAGNLALDDYATPSPFGGEKTHKPIEKESGLFHSATQTLIDFCQTARSNNPADTLALYFLGFAQENLATEKLAILKETMAGVSEGKRACSIHREVLERDPGLVDAKLSLATREFAEATMPWSIKFLAFLIGTWGSKKKALTMLGEVAQEGVYRQLDARVVTALLQAWRGDPRESVRIFQELAEEFPQNYLLDINTAAILERGLKNPQAALKIYQNLLDNLDEKSEGIRAGEVLLRIGKTHYAMKEYSSAKVAFEKTLKAKASEIETPFLSHYYLGRISEEEADSENARKHFVQVLKYPASKEVLRDEIDYSRKKVR